MCGFNLNIINVISLNRGYQVRLLKTKILDISGLIL